MSKKELAEKQSTAVGEVIDYGEYADAGYENQTSEDVVIPFIGVLQALSKAVTEEQDGCKAGMLYDTVEQLPVEDNEVYFVPFATHREYVEWVPQDNGGGFVGRHEVNSELHTAAENNAQAKGYDYGVLKAMRPDGADSDGVAKYVENGNDLVETYYVYGVRYDKETSDPLGPVCLAFSSSKIKVYKKWNTRLRTAKGRAPIFANTCVLGTVPDENKQGKKYYNFEIKSAVENNVLLSRIAPNDARFQAAVEAADLFKTGQANVDYAKQEVGSSQEEGNADGDPF